MTRSNRRGVCECRGCAASDNCRGFVDQLVIHKGLHHEQGEVHAARPIALENGITHMPAPHGQTLALALFEVAPTHDRPPGVAGKNPPARFHLVVDIRKGNEPHEPAGQLLLDFKRRRVYILAIPRNMPAAGKYESCTRTRVVEDRRRKSDG